MNNDGKYVRNSFRHNFDGILTIIGGVWIHLFVGSQYIWGNIKSYVASYFREYNPGLTVSSAFIVFPVLVITNTAMMPLGGYLGKRWNPKLWILIGASFSLVWILLSTLVHPFWMFVILYGVWYGVGSSIMFVVPVVWGWEYFPNHKAVVSGIVIGAFGFGSFIFNLISTSLINPDNVKQVDGYFPPEVADRVPGTLRIIVWWWAGLTLIGLLTVTRPKSQGLATEFNWKIIDSATEKLINNSSLVSTRSNDEEPKQVSIFKIMKTSQFCLLFIMMYCSSFFGYFILNQYKDIGERSIKDDYFLTIVGAVSAAWSGFRFTWAFMMQKMSFKTVYGIMLVMQIAVTIAMYWSTNSRACYMICVWLAIWIQGGHFTILPTICVKLYEERGSQVFTILFSSFGCASMTGVLIVLVLLDSVITYLSVFIFWTALTCVSLFLLVLFFKEEPPVLTYSKVVKQKVKKTSINSSVTNLHPTSDFNSQDKLFSYCYFRSV